MEVRFHVEATQGWLTSMFRDQLPFANSLALNRTALAAQKALRDGIAARFTIRRPWVTQGIMIPRFSDKHDVPMQVSVVLDRSRAFLAKFEPGGVKMETPAGPIAIPSVALRPSFGASVPLAMYPKNLGLVPRRGVTGMIPAKGRLTARGVVQLQGKQRTFVLDESMLGVSVPGVYQRTGPGPHDIHLLWAYKHRIPIPARLEFARTATDAVQTAWPIEWAAAWRRAVSTAR